MSPLRRPRPAAPSLAACLVASLAACASTERAHPVAMAVEPAAHVGTALSGPLVERDPAALDWSRAWSLELSLEYHRHLPLGGTPLIGRAVILDGGEHVFGARARLARGARRLPSTVDPAETNAAGVPHETVTAEASSDRPPAPGSASSRSRPFTGPTVALGAEPTYRIPWGTNDDRPLPPGSTVRWTLRADPTFLGGSRSRWERGELAVTRAREPESAGATTGAEVTLTLEGAVRPAPDRDADSDEPSERGARRAHDPIQLRERLVLAERLPGDGTPLRFALPAPAREAPGGYHVVELRLVTDAEALDPELVVETRALVERSHADALARTSSHDPGFRLESEQALRALERRELRRPALVFLAQSTGAALTEELALVAEPEALSELLEAIAERSHTLESLPEGARPFGGFLERTAWDWLARRAEDASHELEPELGGLLARHAGALADYPDLLREAVAASADPDALAARLVDENRLFLGDAHPAARVRAFDWLARRGAAPAGFDPLGPAEARREALLRSERASEALEPEAEAPEVEAQR